MANWCDNEVVFKGNAIKAESVRAFFKEIQEKQTCEERHWLPPFVIDMEVSDGKINYCSRWIPNNDALVLVAQSFEVGFVNRYDELTNVIFGEASYSEGTYVDIRLELQVYCQSAKGRNVWPAGGYRRFQRWFAARCR